MTKNVREKNFSGRWGAFIKERFPLLNHLLLITFYCSANAVVAHASAGTRPALTVRSVLGGVMILCVFLHLRIFDEIKDFEKDRTAHPERPLPRGLIAVREAKRVAGAIILAEIGLGIYAGPHAFLAACCVIVYSLLMYKEFFIGDWLRPRLATYAFTHTVISCWMSMLIYSSVTGRYFWKASGEYGIFLIANIMMFNVFEFGRKTFAKEEEKDMIESYSKSLGPAGAAVSVFIMAALAVFTGLWLGGVFRAPYAFFIAMISLLMLTLLSSVLYVYFNTAFWAKIFRGASALFILFFNIIITSGFLIR
ncbi:MAG: UbiA family prenyltransferase [Nitrospirota bacterium]|nr:UbiA family prenyltransferase [Nitrospirota bacterium]